MIVRSGRIVTLMAAAVAALAAAPTPSEGQDVAAPADTTSPTRVSPLHPDTVFQMPRGPRVVILNTPGSPVVSLRLLVPLVEEPVEAGSGSVLQRLRLEELRSLARQVGARVEGSRTRRGLAYSISGTAPDFDYLAWLARQAVADPRPDGAEVETAVRAVRAEADHLAETAEGRLRARLRQRVWPDQGLRAGTPTALDRVNRASLRDFWARTHQASRMKLVVVGDVDPVLILAAFQGIGASPEDRPDPLNAPAGPDAEWGELQIIRTWFGQAYVLEDGADPRPAVAARLMAERLRGTSARLEGTVELWEAGTVSALIVMGAAYREGAAEMRRTIRELPGSTARALDPDGFRAALGRVRADILLGARTPWGMASLVGHFAEGLDDPMGAERFLEALNGLGLEEIRSFLHELQERTPIREELRP